MMRPMELSPRLRAVAELVPHGAQYADVGTDHAFLPVWLIEQGVVDHAIASDLRSSPLARARQTAQRHGRTAQLSFRLCNGLAAIGAREVDTISIAGMGGETISAILEQASWTAEGAYRLILQPMSGAPELRVWLVTHGYVLEREVIVREGDTLYLVFLAHPGAAQPLTPAEAWGGQQYPGLVSPHRSAFLAQMLGRAAHALEGVSRSSRPSDVPHKIELQAIYDGLCKMKEEWEQWQP